MTAVEPPRADLSGACAIWLGARKPARCSPVARRLPSPAGALARATCAGRTPHAPRFRAVGARAIKMPHFRLAL